MLALRLRSLPPGTSLSLLFGRSRVTGTGAGALLRLPVAAPAEATPLLVRVWTPTGSAKDALPQPLIDRYVAAVDAHGVISTGHAALEVAPDLYMSHYPAQEIDHSPDDFRRLLRATRDNDVPGLFQPSYAVESAAWCPCTAQVAFERYNGARLRAFWALYRQGQHL